MVWYLVLKKVQNFSWNTVRSTRSIGVKGWYFINFFLICRSYFERITDFQWQEIPENLFEIYLKFISNLFENLIFKGTISATEVKTLAIETRSLMYFSSLDCCIIGATLLSSCT